MTLNLKDSVQFFKIDLYYYRLSESSLIQFTPDGKCYNDLSEWEEMVKQKREQFKHLEPIGYSEGVRALQRHFEEKYQFEELREDLEASNSATMGLPLCHSLHRSGF